jgi:hypothetical protein
MSYVSTYAKPGAGTPGFARLLGGPSQPSLTASDWRAQMLASRFCLSPWMARDMALLCFGEAAND